MRHALQLIANGTGHIRSHVDVDHDHKLTLLEGKLRTREALRGAVDIQIVAFPQSGLMIRPGVYDLLDEAGLAGYRRDEIVYICTRHRVSHLQRQPKKIE